MISVVVVSFSIYVQTQYQFLRELLVVSISFSTDHTRRVIKWVITVLDIDGGTDWIWINYLSSSKPRLSTT